LHVVESVGLAVGHDLQWELSASALIEVGAMRLPMQQMVAGIVCWAVVAIRARCVPQAKRKSNPIIRNGKQAATTRAFSIRENFVRFHVTSLCRTPAATDGRVRR
jgi:hypothetical protein